MLPSVRDGKKGTQNGGVCCTLYPDIRFYCFQIGNTSVIKWSFLRHVHWWSRGHSLPQMGAKGGNRIKTSRASCTKVINNQRI